MGALTLASFVDDFLIAKEIEEGCTPLTIKAYRYDINLFFDKEAFLDQAVECCS